MKPYNVLACAALGLALIAPLPAAADPIDIELLQVTLHGPTSVVTNQPAVYAGSVLQGRIRVPMQPVEVFVNGSLSRSTFTDLDGNYQVSLTFTTTGSHVAEAVIYRGTPLEDRSAPATVTVGIDPNQDYDGDGWSQAQGDCAPNDPTVHPGALDDPDLTYQDRNCDGIDGDAARAIFATPSGNDAQPGTRTQPKKTVVAAIGAAVTAGKPHVYLAEGTYDGQVNLASNVSLFGGYAPGTWARPAGVTTIAGSPSALVASGAVNITVQLVTLSGTRGAGISAYGIQALSGSSLVLDTVTVLAGPGAAGVAGGQPSGTGLTGGPGSLGQPGVENGGGFCKSGSQPQGGLGGHSAAGRPGGRGGSAGLGGSWGSAGQSGSVGTAGGSGTPPGRGNWNPSLDHVGVDGTDGANGNAGFAGSASYGATGYAPSAGANGGPGSPGNGGGGGGGGGGGTFDCDSYGGGGGGGGGGGAGGIGGGGGTSGGGSFGLYVWGSNVVVRSASITTGAGGAGGSGAAGQIGGAGGIGGSAGGNRGNSYGGSTEQDDGSNGARGGNGGTGGTGGPGGGGAGGPSIGVLSGGGSTVSLTAVTYSIGAGGAGGPSSGNFGPAGQSSSTKAV